MLAHTHTHTHTSMHTCASSVPMIHFQGGRGWRMISKLLQCCLQLSPTDRLFSRPERATEREIERRGGERDSERARMREAGSQ